MGSEKPCVTKVYPLITIQKYSIKANLFKSSLFVSRRKSTKELKVNIDIRNYDMEKIGRSFSIRYDHLSLSMYLN